MSEVMLHGVLNMPPELWRDDDPIDQAQRHSRYVQASHRIKALEDVLRDIQRRYTPNGDLNKEIEAALNS